MKTKAHSSLFMLLVVALAALGCTRPADKKSPPSKDLPAQSDMDQDESADKSQQKDKSTAAANDKPAKEDADDEPAEKSKSEAPEKEASKKQKPTEPAEKSSEKPAEKPAEKPESDTPAKPPEPAPEKKPTEKKPTEKKPTEKKPTEKKPTEKKDTAKKDTAKKDTAKKDTAKKDTAKKDAEKKDAEKKDAAKKPADKPAPEQEPAQPEKPEPPQDAPQPESSESAKSEGGPDKPATVEVAKATQGKVPIVKNWPAEILGGGDWPQWGGNSHRNNTPVGKSIPTDFAPGEFDRQTGEWNQETAKNILWVARLGSQTYGNPVVADGRVYVGTNNGAGYLKRYPSKVDLGCLLSFSTEDGSLLWQHSSEKLPSGRVHDWPLQGICCAPLVEGERVWFVTSRGEVRCLDSEGFRDGENDGPFTEEAVEAKDEADVVWVFDMMETLGVSQHNMCSCSVTAAGDLLFVNTSNGVDESHINLPAPDAPSFICLNRNTGKLLWSDHSPGTNILHGQWSSPTFAVLGGVPQVIFGGGDGWVYSFLGKATGSGEPKLLWKFDANPKTSKWILGGSGTRNNIIATPVVYKGLAYVAVGQDPEHGEGDGHLWCIDPTKRGDVSPELAFNSSDPEKPLPHRRIQAVIEKEGDFVRPNPNSAVVWHYSKYDQDGDGDIAFEETMHRSCGTVAIKDDILYIADFSGLFHCLNAMTGKPYWTYDMFAAAWGSPLIVEDKVYIGDEDGDVAIFNLASDKSKAMKDDGGQYVPIAEINMGNSVYSTPIVANGVLYIANKTHLFAIGEQKAAGK